MQLLKYGKVERGVLGVIVQNITPQLADALKLENTKGAIITDVLPNTPAATAGLKIGDVITDIDKHPVHGAAQLRNTMRLIRPKTAVTITIIRDHQVKAIIATAVDPKEIKQKVQPYFGGMRLQNFHELESDGTEIHGVIVASVADNSEGALAGLIPGDVIIAVNSKPINSIETLQKAAENQMQPLFLNVKRGNDNLFLVLTK